MTGIREWLDSHPKTVSGTVSVCVLAALCLSIVELRANRKTYPSGPPDEYFTDDDGQTFFVASSNNIPPFDHNGRQAVHALVFECGGQKFVGYMERYTPAAHDAFVAGKGSAGLMMYGRELKRPGDTTWVKSGDLATEARIENVPCPAGMSGTPMPVEP